MRIRSTLVIAICLAAPLFAQTPPVANPLRDAQTAPPAGTASVTGVALLANNNQPSPIRRARVTLRADDGTMRTTDTDTAGQFRVDQLKGGAYRVVVDKPGFVPLGREPVVDVPDGQSVKTTVMMQRGAAIEGRLVTAEGEPVVGLTVSADRLGYGPYGKKPVAVRQTTTDDLGRFRLHTLAAGEYYIEAAPDPLRTVSGPGNKPAKTYYAGVARLNDARVIALTPGQQMTNVVFTVTTAALANLSGTVTTSAGTAPAAFSLRVQRVGGPTGEVRCLVLPARPGETQSFQCPSVPPGDFRLLVTTRANADANVEFGVLPLTVEGRNLTSLNVSTTPGVAVNGRVEVEGGGALPAGLQVIAPETEYEFPGPSMTTVTAAVPPTPVAADGSFRFSSLAGPRAIRLQQLPGDWALRSVVLDGADISDASTTFAAADRPPTLRVVITAGTGSVAGTVLTTERQPARGARVIVFVDDVQAWRARTRFIKTSLVGAGGRYTVTGLLPGSYRVAFVDGMEDGAWEDPDVITALRPDSMPVTIAAGTRATIDGRIR
jgi:hypothetical protein